MAGTKPSFADMLRHYRLAAGLTQEELAERAQLSPAGIGALERGIRQRPHQATIDLVAEALGLSTPERAALREAARDFGPTEAAVVDWPVDHFASGLPLYRLVGRDDEMNRLVTMLASVEQNHGRVVVLAGETGSGKTRLLRQILTETQRGNFMVVTAAAEEKERRTPYVPFRSALAGLGRAVSGPDKPEVERRSQAIRDLLATETTAGRQSATVAEAVGEKVSDLLLFVATSRPLAIFLDDMQWADAPSLQLLEQLAGEFVTSRILIAGSFCDVGIEAVNPALASLLTKLSHDRLLDIITVRRLSYDETATFLGDTLDGPVSDEFVAFAHRRTKGNPRLLDDLVRSLGGRLQLQGEIGAGAMGRVFRAYDSVTGSTVAAKLMLARAGIDLDALLRFQQEGAVLRSMDHPHIVRIHDSFVEEHVSCIVMELLEGKSLAKILTDGPLDLERVKAMALQIADALDYAHTQSIVHRDVKPDNIMVLEGDRVKVTDFGIARILSVDTKMGTIATTGMRVGTPLYMSPEQIEGKKVDARSDIYGFGAVLYHMVTGGPPFEGDDALEIAVKQMKEDPPPPSRLQPRLPREWNTVILKALAKDPRRRFQSAKDMKASLDQLPTTLMAKPRQPASRWKSWGAVASMLIVVLGGALAYSATTSHARGATLSSYLSGLAAEGQLSGTVLVAEHGKVILDEGYGMANRAKHIRNGPDTEYGLANATTTALLTAETRQVNQPHEVYDWIKNLNSGFCGTDAPPSGNSILVSGGCPAKWRKITMAQLVAGTSRLPNYPWNRLGNSLAQMEAGCASRPLEGRDFPPIHYTSCANVIMALVDPGVVTPVPAGSWMPTGLIPNAKNTKRLIGHMNLVRRVPQLAHQLFDGMSSPRLALDYDSSGHHVNDEYNDYFTTYSTAPHLYRYDNLLFSGTYMPPPNTRAELSPRDIAAPPGLGVKHVEWADGWKVGSLFDSRVDYTAGSLYNYQTANLRFPKVGVTAIVISNSATSDALLTAEQAAAFVLPGRQAQLAAADLPASASLVGAYRRPVRPADVDTIDVAYNLGPSHDGLPLPLATGPQHLTLTIGPNVLSLGAKQRYSASNSGDLSIFGPPPGLSTTHFCTGQETDLTPTGYYHWAFLGNQLIITKVSDRFCSNRAELMLGTWTRVGKSLR